MSSGLLPCPGSCLRLGLLHWEGTELGGRKEKAFRGGRAVLTRSLHQPRLDPGG